MATKTENKEKKSAAAEKEVNFKCHVCGQFKTIQQMRIITRFFPVLIVCPDCEKKFL
jgi:Zn finger protein HypA/HybF involved in hydrogenase expression